ncbi:MAG: glycosyltransferase family 2 protein [Prevotella sp.]|nr:glycosyltransferase family 2 protein [Prevotella sp.]
MKSISIIIPTYKPQDFLRQCILSIAQQTLDHRLFEVIIVLNGCEEPYLTQVREWAETAFHDIEFRLIHTHQPGVSNARNLAIDASVGQYICLIDDDDWISPDYLKVMLGYASADSITVSDVQNHYDDPNVIDPDNAYLSRAYHQFKAAERISILKGKSFLSSSCCKLIPRTVVGNFRFDTKFKQSEDALFMAAISKNIAHVIIAPPDAVYYRRIWPSSAGRSSYSIWQRFCQMMRLSKAFLRIWLSDIRHYSAPFFANRVAAAIKRFFLFWGK